ncbi:nuclear transport factor 2 family protein [Romeria aff. gracilis LEGE 07310]|uniref:Nuclear transport factor 2 family protein n=1 Tax=Vasconcelosia minhoensis LEGE 07310 TaxID=915328 RepID=A0A8J7ARF5_9CYAN|nr:nuclear transport factor 2 family protein [Romeria gracilis]MBE9079239.1 nuclear transport factor 2 family protein [Romeria aff. gracilis LEGE 07310]
MIGALIAKQRAKAQFAARARGDIDQFLAAWTDDAALTFPGEPPWGGTHRGKAKIRKWFERFYERFPQAHFTAENIFVSNPLALTANNEVAVEWSATFGGRAERDRGVVVAKIRNGKAVNLTEYFFQPPRDPMA